MTVPSRAAIVEAVEARHDGLTARPIGDLTVRRHLRWRDERLYLGGLWVGEVMLWQSPPQVGRWRAWSTAEEPGTHHGWHATEYDARREVERAVVAALAAGPRDQLD
jgi:hypothetical protein